MKRLALAVGLVFAFSSAAFAINFSSTTMTLEGYNTWQEGKLVTSKATDTRSPLKLASSGTGWKAMAEFAYDGKNLTVDDWYYTTTEKLFKLELWGWGEDQNADYATPFSWVNETDDAPANWEARLTTTVAGNESVFAIENDSKAPIYYVFSKKAFGTTTAGVAYKTQFNYNNTFDAWATGVVSDVTVTGEVASIVKPGARKNNVGVKASLKSGLALQAYVNQAYAGETNDVKFFEAIQTPTDVLSRYLGSYKVEAKGGKVTTTADVRFRASNDQAIADIFNIADGVWDVNDFGDNDWLKNKGWAAGANLVNVKDAGKATNTITLNASYVPVANTNAMATIKMVKGDTTNTTGAIRAYWKSQDAKLSLHPRVFFTTGYTKLGSYAIYSINAGQLAAGYWKQFNKEGAVKSVSQIELGYQLNL